MVSVPFSPGIQIHSSGQNPAPLMVRMVSADLGTAGGGEIALRRSTECFGKACVQNVLFFGSKDQFRHGKSSCICCFLHYSREQSKREEKTCPDGKIVVK